MRRQALVILVAALSISQMGVVVVRRAAVGGGVSVRSFETNGDTSSNTTASCTMPATVEAGDLLVVMAGKRGAVDATPTYSSSGWTCVLEARTNALDMDMFYCSKTAAGTEDGTTVDFTDSNAANGVAVCSSTALSGAAGTLEVESEVTLTAESCTTPALAGPGTGTVALRWNQIAFGADATNMDCTTGCADGEEGAQAIPGSDVDEIEGYFGYESLSGSDGTATFTWTTSSRVFCMTVEVE